MLLLPPWCAEHHEAAARPAGHGWRAGWMNRPFPSGQFSGQGQAIIAPAVGPSGLMACRSPVRSKARWLARMCCHWSSNCRPLDDFLGVGTEEQPSPHGLRYGEREPCFPAARFGDARFWEYSACSMFRPSLPAAAGSGPTGRSTEGAIFIVLVIRSGRVTVKVCPSGGGHLDSKPASVVARVALSSYDSPTVDRGSLRVTGVVLAGP